MVDFSSVNGQASSVLDIRDRGLAYGDGLFETMRLHSGQIVLLDQHLRRLKLGCERLYIPFDEALVRRYIAGLLSELNTPESSGVIKLILSRGQGGHGYIPPKISDTQPTIIVQCTLHPPSFFEQEQGALLHLCQYPLSSNTRLAGIKHLNRLEYVLAGRDVPAGQNQYGLLLDERGFVVESLHHNVFIVKGDTLLTPRLRSCGVAGVMRGLLINNLCLKLAPKMKVFEVDLTLDDLYAADEVFLSNSLRGFCHISKFKHSHWAQGPVVQQLKILLAQIWSSGHVFC